MLSDGPGTAESGDGSSPAHARGFAHYRTGILTAILLGAIAVYLAAIEFDPETPGLGNNTTSIRDATVAGHPVRDNARPVLHVLEDLPICVDGCRPIIWLGNSHQHAVNGMQPGDTVSSVYLHRQLNGETYPGDYPTIGISYPNLRFEEQLLLTLALVLGDPAQRPRVIVQGVRFHDAREMGVRSYLRPLFRLTRVDDWIDDPSVDSVRHADPLDRLRNDRRAARSAIREEEGFEAWLVATLGPKVPIFQKRDFIHAVVRSRLHRLRDWAFRIDTTDKRPILRSRYTLAVQFLELSLEVASQQGVAVLLYNSPLRREVENPYIPDEYARFRSDLSNIAERHGAAFQDYDELIPRNLWGRWVRTDFPDFSHFTAAGHRLLADRVRRDIASDLGLDDGGLTESGVDALQ